MTIHQKVNCKGNLSRWLGPNSFIRNVALSIKSGYEVYERGGIGERILYPQDKKTNFLEPKEPDYNAPTERERAEEMNRVQRTLK